MCLRNKIRRLHKTQPKKEIKCVRLPLRLLWKARVREALTSISQRTIPVTSMFIVSSGADATNMGHAFGILHLFGHFTSRLH